MLKDNIFVQLKQNSNGFLFYYDKIRKKWLSVHHDTIFFSTNHDNISTNRWMSIENIPSNLGGYRIPKNGTIISSSVQSSNFSNVNFYVKNNLLSDLFSITLSSEKGKLYDNLNIDVFAGDSIKVLLETISGVIDYPILIINIAWKENF